MRRTGRFDRTTAAWGAGLVALALGVTALLAMRGMGAGVVGGFCCGWCAAMGALLLAIAAW